MEAELRVATWDEYQRGLESGLQLARRWEPASSDGYIEGLDGRELFGRQGSRRDEGGTIRRFCIMPWSPCGVMWQCMTKSPMKRS